VPLSFDFGGAAGIEPDIRHATPLLEISQLLVGAILRDTPTNTPIFIGCYWT
jgi:hypothetical protein